MLDGSFLFKYIFFLVLVIISPSVLFTAPIIIAHRGGAALSPENTRAAFHKSLKANIPYIEFDVQISKDGIPVVFHDETFERLTDGMIDDPIEKFTLKGLKSIDIGSWFSPKYHEERILTLKEAFEIIPPNTGIMVELKDNKTDNKAFVKAVNKVFSNFILTHHQVVVGSLSPALVKELLSSNSPYPVVGIVDELADAIEFSVLDLKHLAVNVDLFTIPTFISLIENRNYKLWSWVVNSKEFNRICDDITFRICGARVENFTKAGFSHRNFSRAVYCWAVGKILS